jgi:F0F1-type ATP synthase assembly protein I
MATDGENATDPEAERKRLHRERRRQMRISAIGFQFCFSIAIGALGGRWLDEKLGTGPWLLVVGLVLGAVAAYRDLINLAREHKRETDGNGGG